MTDLFHPSALEEYQNAARRYFRIDAALGERFYAEVQRLIRLACADPEQFRQFDPPARRCLSHKFPYAVIYVNGRDGVRIVAVMHLHRQEGYWRKRIGSQHPI